MRRTPLKGRRKPLKARKGLRKGKTKAKSPTALTRAKKAKRFREQFGPPGFVEWMKARPCKRCGKVDWRDGKPDNAVHHDPTRGNGGTWQDTSTLCQLCHTAGPRARHTVGVVTFWRSVGITYTEANAETQAAWLRYTNGA